MLGLSFTLGLDLCLCLNKGLGLILDFSLEMVSGFGHYSVVIQKKIVWGEGVNFQKSFSRFFSCFSLIHRNKFFISRGGG